MAWQLKACFERQCLRREWREKALFFAVAAAVSLTAGYAVYRYRETIEGAGLNLCRNYPNGDALFPDDCR